MIDDFAKRVPPSRLDTLTYVVPVRLRSTCFFSVLADLGVWMHPELGGNAFLCEKNGV